MKNKIKCACNVRTKMILFSNENLNQLRGFAFVSSHAKTNRSARYGPYAASSNGWDYSTEKPIKFEKNWADFRGCIVVFDRNLWWLGRQAQSKLSFSLLFWSVHFFGDFRIFSQRWDVIHSLLHLPFFASLLIRLCLVDTTRKLSSCNRV